MKYNYTRKTFTTEYWMVRTGKLWDVWQSGEMVFKGGKEKCFNYMKGNR